MANLTLLCRYHHRLVHEGGFTIQCQNNNELAFLRPDGRTIPTAPPPPNFWPEVEDTVRESQVNVSAETCRPLWRGETMDIHQAMDCMLQRSPGGLDYAPLLHPSS